MLQTNHNLWTTLKILRRLSYTLSINSISYTLLNLLGFFKMIFYNIDLSLNNSGIIMSVSVILTMIDKHIYQNGLLAVNKDQVNFKEPFLFRHS